ncbi:MAG: hypothetical protein QOG58_2737, partial [Caballeronia sp.]|nr:hypothetical protein [Caballeronia sp.]
MKNLQPDSAFYPISPRYLFKICAGLLIVVCIGSCGGSSNSPTTTASAGDASGTTASPSAASAPSTTTPAPSTPAATPTTTSPTSTAPTPTTTPTPATTPTTTPPTTSGGATTGPTPTAVQSYATDVLMHHNDLARTGQMLAETTLTLANVNSTAFGKLRFLPADGKVDGQPLFVTNLTMG